MPERIGNLTFTLFVDDDTNSFTAGKGQETDTGATSAELAVVSSRELDKCSPSGFEPVAVSRDQRLIRPMAPHFFSEEEIPIGVTICLNLRCYKLQPAHKSVDW